MIEDYRSWDHYKMTLVISGRRGKIRRRSYKGGASVTNWKNVSGDIFLQRTSPMQV